MNNAKNDTQYLVKSMSAGAAQMMMAVPLYFVGAARGYLSELNLPNNTLGYSLSLLKPLTTEEASDVMKSFGIKQKYAQILKKCTVGLQLGTAIFMSYRAIEYFCNLGDEDTALKDINYSWIIAALNTIIPLTDLFSTATGRLRLNAINKQKENGLLEVYSVDVDRANSNLQGILVHDAAAAKAILTNNLNKITIHPDENLLSGALYRCNTI